MGGNHQRIIDRLLGFLLARCRPLFDCLQVDVLADVYEPHINAEAYYEAYIVRVDKRTLHICAQASKGNPFFVVGQRFKRHRVLYTL